LLKGYSIAVAELGIFFAGRILAINIFINRQDKNTQPKCYDNGNNKGDIKIKFP